MSNLGKRRTGTEFGRKWKWHGIISSIEGTLFGHFYTGDSVVPIVVNLRINPSPFIGKLHVIQGQDVIFEQTINENDIISTDHSTYIRFRAGVDGVYATATITDDPNTWKLTGFYGIAGIPFSITVNGVLQIKPTGQQ